jgi:hypothetical protein
MARVILFAAQAILDFMSGGKPQGMVNLEVFSSPMLRNTGEKDRACMAIEVLKMGALANPRAKKI